MLPKVIGSPAGDRGRAPMSARIPWPLPAKAAVVADIVDGGRPATGRSAFDSLLLVRRRLRKTRLWPKSFVRFRHPLINCLSCDARKYPFKYLFVTKIKAMAHHSVRIKFANMFFFTVISILFNCRYIFPHVKTEFSAAYIGPIQQRSATGRF
jgi:hypothetical protein